MTRWLMVEIHCKVLTGQYSLLEVYMYLISYVYVLNMSYHEAYNISCNILSMMRSRSGLGTFRHCVIPWKRFPWCLPFRQLLWGHGSCWPFLLYLMGKGNLHWASPSTEPTEGEINPMVALPVITNILLEMYWICGDITGGRGFPKRYFVSI